MGSMTIDDFIERLKSIADEDWVITTDERIRCASLPLSFHKLSGEQRVSCPIEALAGGETHYSEAAEDMGISRRADASRPTGLSDLAIIMGAADNTNLRNPRMKELRERMISILEPRELS